MITATTAFRQELAKDNRNYQIIVSMVLADDTTLRITNKDIVQGTFKVEDSTSASNTFTVGGLVTGKCSFVLKNEGTVSETFTGDGSTTAFGLAQRRARILTATIDGEYSEIGYSYANQSIVFDEAPESGAVIVVTYRYEDAFSGYDFGGANFTAQVGLEIESTDATEYIMVGRYTVTEMDYNDSTISLVAYDRAYLLSVDFDDSAITYPTTLYTLLYNVMTQSGVTLGDTSDLTLYNNYTVAAAPSTEMTCADVVACIAQINCCYARVNNIGNLDFGWYDIDAAHDVVDGYDGGTFNYDGYTESGEPEAELDGGTFAYNDGDSISGGSFGDRAAVHIIYGLSAQNICTDDVVITGVSVTEEFDETEEDTKDTVTLGTDNYLVKISGNPYIQSGQAQTVASAIYAKLANMTFRPFNISCLSDPTMEAGDVCVVVDRKGNMQAGFISTRTFIAGNYENLVCDAEEPIRNSLKNLSNIAKAISTAKSEAEARIAELKALETSAIAQVKQAQAAFSSLVSNSLGGYSTQVQQADGSYIYYFHNASTLAGSRTVWRISSDTVSWTNAYTGDDTTTNWTNGFDSGGNAVLHSLSADWITAGTLSADYIQGGTLDVGGNGNANGVITVKGSDGSTKITLNNSGIILSPDTKIAYSNISGTPTIPTDTSDLTNGAGYQTSIGVNSIITNTVTASFINALNITADSIVANASISSPNITGGTIEGATLTTTWNDNYRIKISGNSIAGHIINGSSYGEIGYIKFKAKNNSSAFGLFSVDNNTFVSIDNSTSTSAGISLRTYLGNIGITAGDTNNTGFIISGSNDTIAVQGTASFDHKITVENGIKLTKTVNNIEYNASIDMSVDANTNIASIDLSNVILNLTNVTKIKVRDEDKGTTHTGITTRRKNPSVIYAVDGIIVEMY